MGTCPGKTDVLAMNSGCLTAQVRGRGRRAPSSRPRLQRPGRAATLFPEPRGWGPRACGLLSPGALLAPRPCAARLCRQRRNGPGCTRGPVEAEPGGQVPSVMASDQAKLRGSERERPGHVGRQRQSPWGRRQCPHGRGHRGASAPATRGCQGEKPSGWPVWN